MPQDQAHQRLSQPRSDLLNIVEVLYMTIETSQEIVDAIIGGDQEQFNAAFQNAMATKVADALEIKKVEVASNWLGAAEDSVEAPEVETEVVQTEPEVETTEQ